MFWLISADREKNAKNNPAYWIRPVRWGMHGLFFPDLFGLINIIDSPLRAPCRKVCDACPGLHCTVGQPNHQPALLYGARPAPPDALAVGISHRYKIGAQVLTIK